MAAATMMIVRRRPLERSSSSRFARGGAGEWAGDAMGPRGPTSTGRVHVRVLSTCLGADARGERPKRVRFIGLCGEDSSPFAGTPVGSGTIWPALVCSRAACGGDAGRSGVPLTSRGPVGAPPWCVLSPNITANWRRSGSSVSTVVAMPARSLASFRARNSAAVRKSAEPGGIVNRTARSAKPGNRPSTSAIESLKPTAITAVGGDASAGSTVGAASESSAACFRSDGGRSRSFTEALRSRERWPGGARRVYGTARCRRCGRRYLPPHQGLRRAWPGLCRRLQRCLAGRHPSHPG